MGIAVEVRKAGRIVIPLAQRKLYDIREGDIVELEILKVKHPDGTIVDLSNAMPQEAVADA